MTSSSSLKTNLTTQKCNIEAPAEPRGTLSDHFFLPPTASDRVPLSSIESFSQQLVKFFSPYSMAVKVDAAREMIKRLERRCL